MDTSLIRREDTPTGHTIIQVDAKGQNCIIVYGGTNRRITPEYIAEALSGFGDGDMVLLQNEVNRLGEIIDAAHARGMRVRAQSIAPSTPRCSSATSTRWTCSWSTR